MTYTNQLNINFAAWDSNEWTESDKEDFLKEAYYDIVEGFDIAIRKFDFVIATEQSRAICRVNQILRDDLERRRNAMIFYIDQLFTATGEEL